MVLSSANSNRSSHDPHLIRLHGPWHATKGASRNLEFGIEDAGSSKPIRVKVPLDFGQYRDLLCGTVVLERSFNRPTNLTDQQPVHLIVQAGGLILDSASLNGNDLIPSPDTQSDSGPGSTPPLNPLSRFNISSILKQTNRLSLTWSMDEDPIGKLQLVALEIHDLS